MGCFDNEKGPPQSFSSLMILPYNDVMPKQLILVAGNIGAGKTSLTERIGDRLGWTTAYESIIGNPYLADFYADMRKWSFHLQVFLLGHRAQQHLDLAADPNSAVLDRSIYEDAYIFARALNHLGNLADVDYTSYLTLFELVVKSLPSPDLLIYLHAPVSLLIERIHRRARDIETGITPEYLTLLDSYYEEWIQSFDICPVLTIETGDLDFVNHPPHLDLVIEGIKNRLAGREKMVF